MFARAIRLCPRLPRLLRGRPAGLVVVAWLASVCMGCPSSEPTPAPTPVASPASPPKPIYNRRWDYAVGTYIGVGSFLFGADTCSYSGDPGVFQDNDGPRLIIGPGRFIKKCNIRAFENLAITPTGVEVRGPSRVGTADERDGWYTYNFEADGRELRGKGHWEWALSPNCEGVAQFGHVNRRSSHTGGPDRHRTLVPEAPGVCTLVVRVTTGSPVLYPEFTPQTFTGTLDVTIEAGVVRKPRKPTPAKERTLVEKCFERMALVVLKIVWEMS